MPPKRAKTYQKLAQHLGSDPAFCPALATAANRKLFVFEPGLNWKAKAQPLRCKARLASIPKITVTRRDIPYPPPNSLVADTLEIAKLWKNSNEKGKLADKRQKRPNLNHQLVLTILQDESVMLFDERHNLVGLVLRNFVLRPSVLDDMVAVGKESAETREA
ncbi:hypothetical protein AX14_011136 [Amanita brunnescens Koide BX004]|nr:hypothetical protein AX14_011136 [Amanita brunnescens Koide BX004]